MLADVLLVLLGLAVLVAGGEALVRGASGLALLARVPPAVVGMTIVAAGTSMPELVVSLGSAADGRPGMALGNLVGSNIFNIGAILGLAALVRPLRIRGNSVRMEWPVMALAACQLHLLARDGAIDRLEGGALLAALVAFTAYVVWVGRKVTTPSEREELGDVCTASFGRTGRAAWLLNAGTVLLGVALLAGGSSVLVGGASSLASGAGVSDTVVGLTIVAMGTSAPELVTSLVASWRGRDDVAVTNVLGSNIFNVLGIAGATALVQPLPAAAEIVGRDDWWMLGFTLALFPLMRSGMRVNRAEGAVLLGGFLAYVTLLLRGA